MEVEVTIGIELYMRNRGLRPYTWRPNSNIVTRKEGTHPVCGPIEPKEIEEISPGSTSQMNGRIAIIVTRSEL